MQTVLGFIINALGYIALGALATCLVLAIVALLFKAWKLVEKFFVHPTYERIAENAAAITVAVFLLMLMYAFGRSIAKEFQAGPLVGW